MQEISINFWALLGFVAVRIAVGMVWYSPGVFWKPWSKVTKISEKDMKAGMVKGMASDLIGSLIMAFVLLHAIKYAGASHDLAKGLAVSFFNWLGLVATVQFGMTAYENRPTKFFGIISGYQLVTILLGGAVLTMWG